MRKDSPDFDWFFERLMENRHNFRGDEEIVREATKVIWNTIHSSVDVNSIVEELPVTRRTLERYFRDQFGHTIREVVALARLELAKWLLSETPLPIHTIAKQAGYSSSDWMGKVIRQNTGATPTEYRNRSCR